MKINVDDYLMWLLMEGNRIKDTTLNSEWKKLPGKRNIFSGRLCKEKIKTVAADLDGTSTYIPISEMV